MKLSETFGSPQARQYKVVVFVDIVDSTAAKEKEREAAWLTTTGWFLDVVTDIVEASVGGAIVKYLGDGVMAVFDDEHAAEAINAAIQIQETMARANDGHQVACNCSIGVASGEVVCFETSRGDDDYIGTVCDRAARLCAAASAKAVFVDRATVTTALMNRVKSNLGAAENPRRTVDEYQGDLQKIIVKGFSSAVEYYEVYWDKQRYGVKSAVPTAAADSAQSSRTTDGSSKTPGSERIRGLVKRWDAEKGQGFCVAGDETFYFDRRFTAAAVDLQPGEVVFFLPRDPMVEGKCRVASCVTPLDHEVDARVVTLNEVKNFAFVQVQDSFGNTQDLFTFLENGSAGFARGSRVSVLVSENARGPVGAPVAEHEEEALVA